MKILLTGASSFTGFWFASALADAGHEVVATLRGRAGDYEALRWSRIERMTEKGVRFLEQASFGDDRFLAAIDGCQLVCHHAAEVSNYQSLDFDVGAALAANTANARTVMDCCAAAGVSAFIATGSVFEQNEGAGEGPLRAFSPYGLSKSLSWQVLDYWAANAGLAIGKFVIPNPFGPFEEARFCAHLMRSWANGTVPGVRTPAYVRDNIPVDLLAMRYVRFAEDMGREPRSGRCAPSGYVESQGRFAERFAREIGGRISLATPLDLAEQTEFPEPVMRTNTDFARLDWDESRFWDAAAEYYRQTYCR